MENKDSASRSVARMLRADELYRAGLNLRQCGERFEPPVSAQRVGQLLTEGAQRGLFRDPRRNLASRADKERLTSEVIFEAMRRLGNRRMVARELGISDGLLRRRFASEIGCAKRERRTRQAEQSRRETIGEYLRLAARLGRNPTSADLRPTALGRRITRVFGTFASFWTELGEDPDYTREGWRKNKSR